MYELFLRVHYPLILFIVIVVNIVISIIGCDDKGVIEPPVTGQVFFEMYIDPNILPFEGGTFTINVYSDWFGGQPADISIEIWNNNNNDNCLAYLTSFSIYKNIPYTATINTSSFFASCRDPNQIYSINAYAHGDTFIQYLTWGSQSLIVTKAYDMLTGCPSFYEPPSWYNDWDTLLNNTGSVAWTSQGLTNNLQNETKESYICRLNIAKQNNPSNWLQYLCISTIACNNYGSTYSGIPFPYNLPLWPPNYYNHYSQNCQGGFVCYAFIYAAAKSANYQMPYGEPTSVGYFQQYQLIPANNRQIGDIILYDLDTIPSNGYEHAGIITEVNSSNIRLDKVISSFGFSEHFQWGAKEVKLWDFHSTLTTPPGIFTPVPPYGSGNWSTNYDKWNESNIKLYRLR